LCRPSDLSTISIRPRRRAVDDRLCHRQPCTATLHNSSSPKSLGLILSPLHTFRHLHVHPRWRYSCGGSALSLDGSQSTAIFPHSTNSSSPMANTFSWVRPHLSLVDSYFCSHFSHRSSLSASRLSRLCLSHTHSHTRCHSKQLRHRRETSSSPAGISKTSNYTWNRPTRGGPETKFKRYDAYIPTPDSTSIGLRPWLTWTRRPDPYIRRFSAVSRL
jgi:hypothetical protein